MIINQSQTSQISKVTLQRLIMLGVTNSRYPSMTRGVIDLNCLARSIWFALGLRERVELCPMLQCYICNNDEGASYVNAANWQFALGWFISTLCRAEAVSLSGKSCCEQVNLTLSASVRLIINLWSLRILKGVPVGPSSLHIWAFFLKVSVLLIVGSLQRERTESLSAWWYL